MLTSRLPAVFAALLMAMLCLPRPASAQVAGLPPDLSSPDVDPNYKPTLAFDIATIRPAEREGRRLSVGVDSPPHASHFQANSVTLRILIQIAYGFGPIQVVGGPDWLDSGYYKVEAKSDHSVDEQLAKLTDAEARLEKIHMLQSLLTDRMHLKAHWETREGRAYDLILAKGGAKLHPTPVPAGTDGQPATVAGALGPAVSASGSRHGIEMQCRRFNMHALTMLLASQLHMPVIDKTGLDGTYDFTLQYAHEYDASDPEAFPSLSTAVQEQLGLKLDSSRGAVDTLVIDHVDPPTEN